jgi:hypothetical protein
MSGPLVWLVALVAGAGLFREKSTVVVGWLLLVAGFCSEIKVLLAGGW